MLHRGFRHTGNRSHAPEERPPDDLWVLTAKSHKGQIVLFIAEGVQMLGLDLLSFEVTLRLDLGGGHGFLHIG